MLELKNITKDYVIGDFKVKALKGIDIKFRKNEFVCVLGPSGCGKTTLLNIIGGLDKYTSGDLVIDNKSTKAICRQRLGYIQKSQSWFRFPKL
jgi:putative ABC transport system permease protein